MLVGRRLADAERPRRPAARSRAPCTPRSSTGCAAPAPAPIAYDFVFAEPTETEEDNALILATRRAREARARRDAVRRGGPLGGLRRRRGRRGRAARTSRRARSAASRCTDRGAPTHRDRRRAHGHRPRARRGPTTPGSTTPAPRAPSRRYSFSDVLAGDVPAERFRDRVVVVGATDPVLQDIQPTLRRRRDAGRRGPGQRDRHRPRRTSRSATRPAGWRRCSSRSAGLVTPLAALRLTGPALAARPARRARRGLAGRGPARVRRRDRPARRRHRARAGRLVPRARSPSPTPPTSLDRRRLRAAFARFVPPDVVDELVARSDDGVRLGRHAPRGRPCSSATCAASRRRPSGWRSSASSSCSTAT